MTERRMQELPSLILLVVDDLFEIRGYGLSSDNCSKDD